MLEIQRTNHTGQVTWCWERWKAGGEGDDRGGDGWMASLTPWTGAWESSGIWRRKGKHAVLHGVTKSRTQLSDGTTEQQPQSHMKAFPPQVATRAQVKDRCAQHLSESLGSSSPASRIISPLSATLTSSALPSTLSHWSKCRRPPLLVRLSYKATMWTSLEVQWLRICLPMKTTWVWPLVREDPRCHGATKPVHNY